MKHPPNKPSPTPPATSRDLFCDAPLPTAPLNDSQRLACLRLIRSENVGPVTFRQLINHFGGAEQALDALPELAQRGGGKRAIKICSKQRAESELASAAAHGVVPLFTIEPGYPAALARLEVPPPLIYVKGRQDLLNRPAMAIVGSRNASAAGCKLARHFASELGQAGLVICSGLARGIDGAAHRNALEHGTIGVLAGGLDMIYPPEHEDLHHKIGNEGCLVSEMPCGFQPRAKDFPRRNRLISGLSLGVLVIEAARRSGTLVTARYGGEQNREVFAVPGHPLDPRAQGTNQLLKSGATLVTETEDILETLRPLLSAKHQTNFAFREPAPQTDWSDKSESLAHDCDQDRSGNETAHAIVLSALSASPIDSDELARTTGLAIRQVNAVLLELDLAGLIVRHGHQLVSRAEPAPQAQKS
ncbi:MAG: DNA-processing protein DprA [Hyphomicrobiaceae bacterium]